MKTDRGSSLASRGIGPAVPRWMILLIVWGSLLIGPARTAENESVGVNTVNITAPVKFVDRDALIYLVLSDGTQKIELLAGAKNGKRRELDLLPVSLVEGKTYTFTVEEVLDPNPKAGARTKSRTLIHVADADEMVYDRGICEVHHRKLEWQEFPVSYGLLRPGSQPSWEERRKQFPHPGGTVNGTIPGGCIVGESKTARVLVCAECAQAFAQWKPKPLAGLSPGKKKVPAR